MSEGMSREANTLGTLLLLAFIKNPVSHLSYSPIFNLFCYMCFLSGILSLVFPFPVNQLAANSFAIWEFHKSAASKAHPSSPPASSPTVKRAHPITSDVFPCVASFSQSTYSQSYFPVFLSLCTLHRAVYDQ